MLRKMSAHNLCAPGVRFLPPPRNHFSRALEHTRAPGFTGHIKAHKGGFLALRNRLRPPPKQKTAPGMALPTLFPKQSLCIACTPPVYGQGAARSPPSLLRQAGFHVRRSDVVAARRERGRSALGAWWVGRTPDVGLVLTGGKFGPSTPRATHHAPHPQDTRHPVRYPAHHTSHLT